jgi:hypothetical protein
MSNRLPREAGLLIVRTASRLVRRCEEAPNSAHTCVVSIRSPNQHYPTKHAAREQQSSADAWILAGKPVVCSYLKL